MLTKALVAAAAALACGCAGMHGAIPMHGEPPKATTTAISSAYYAPYRFLVGVWNVGPESGAAAAVARVRWGPGEFDLAGGRVQEQGTVSVQPDGTVLREITAFYSPGAGPHPHVPHAQIGRRVGRDVPGERQAGDGAQGVASRAGARTH
jgi:hypothetical protein